MVSDINSACPSDNGLAHASHLTWYMASLCLSLLHLPFRKLKKHKDTQTLDIICRRIFFYFLAFPAEEIEFIRLRSNQQRATATPSCFSNAQFASSTDQMEKDIQSTIELDSSSPRIWVKHEHFQYEQSSQLFDKFDITENSPNAVENGFYNFLLTSF